MKFKDNYALKVDELSTGYGSHIVLDAATFQLEKGKILGIIGPNGSGKSTLLKTIGGLIPKLGGEVMIGNKKKESFLAHQMVKSGVSFFTQRGLVIPSLTIEEHFMLAAQNSNGSRNCQQAYDLFPRLYELRKQRAGSLSGGERQILSFGILMIQDTKIWLLDEPTAGLSPEMVSLTKDFLQEKNKDEAISMLLVEHNMEVAFALSDHIVVVREGVLSEKFSRETFQDERFLNKHVYL